VPRDVLRSPNGVNLLNQELIQAKLLVPSLQRIFVCSKKVHDIFAVNQDELTGLIRPLVHVRFVCCHFLLKSHHDTHANPSIG